MFWALLKKECYMIICLEESFGGDIRVRLLRLEMVWNRVADVHETMTVDLNWRVYDKTRMDREGILKLSRLKSQKHTKKKWETSSMRHWDMTDFDLALYILYNPVSPRKPMIKSPPKTNTKEKEKKKKLGGSPMLGCMFVYVYIFLSDLSWSERSTYIFQILTPFLEWPTKNDIFFIKIFFFWFISLFPYFFKISI